MKLGYNVMERSKNIRKAPSKSALSRATTFWWHGLFISGKESIGDKEREKGQQQ